MLRPTAIPEDPLIRRFGTFDGMTIGSVLCPSKFSATSTVSFSMSARIWPEIAESFASVYRYAAAESPSIEPKFPCPSINGYLKENSCTILTRASYTAESPCGWYLPKTSPTTVAHFLYGFSGLNPASCIAKSIRR